MVHVMRCNSEDRHNTRGGATLKIGEYRTMMPSLLEPVATVLTQRELRSSYGRWPVPPGSVPYEKHTAHNYSDNYILELTLYTMNGEVN